MPAITKTLVSGLEAGDKDYFVWDEEVSGFGVKVTPAGKKSYQFTFWLNGAKPRMKIGDHGTWTPQAARDEAKRLRRLVDQGFDPRNEKKQRRHDQVALEVGAYVERFIERYMRENWNGGFKGAAAMLRNRVVPVWQGRHLKEIGRSDVRALLETFETQAPRRLCHALIRKMFKWAVNNGDIEDSPMRDMEAPSPPRSRDRVLSEEEVALCWHASTKLDYPFGQFFRLLLVTAQRRSEVAEMRWEELDRSRRLWTIPAERAKNNIVSDVPLSDAAVATLDSIADLFVVSDDQAQPKWPRVGFVFTTTGKSAVSGYSKAKARLDRETLSIAKRIAKANGEDPDEVTIKPWRPHDLRRTVATGCQRFGVAREVTESILNHKSGSLSGVAGVYQRHDYREEKRAALEQWAAHVAKIVAAFQIPQEMPVHASTDRDILLHAA